MAKRAIHLVHGFKRSKIFNFVETTAKRIFGVVPIVVKIEPVVSS